MESPYTVSNPRKDRLIPPLQDMHITVVGLGGGAPIPIELAKCGIQNFHFYDMDQLDVGNLIRHPCGVKHVGMSKADAVAEHLQDMSGGLLHINTFNENVFESDQIHNSVQASDLVIIATDNEASRFFLSELASASGTPAIFVGMFERGMGGEIFAQIPGEGCYACLAEYLGRKMFIQEYVSSLDKKDCSSVRDVQSMPGLGMDQGILCQIAARKSLDILLRNHDTSLQTIGKNWIVFSICGIHRVLADTLSSIQQDVPKHSGCYLCR